MKKEVVSYGVAFQNLKVLPKDTPNVVHKRFDCSCNQLTSLKNAPVICGTFSCTSNPLKILEWEPESIETMFIDVEFYQNNKEQFDKWVEEGKIKNLIKRNVYGIYPM